MHDAGKKTMRRELIRGMGERSWKAVRLERAHLRAIRSQVVNPQVASMIRMMGPRLTP